MAYQSEKLAVALEALREVAHGDIVRSERLSRTYRERLIKTGFLEPVIRGWLLVTNPEYPPGATVPWYSAYWAFVSQYLEGRFGDEYCLSPEASIKLHVQSPLIPQQLIVTVNVRDNNLLTLPHGTSILTSHSLEPFPKRKKIDGIWVIDLAAALCKISEPFYRNYPDDVELALRMIGDPSELLYYLLDSSSSVVAGRLAGAYEFLGNTRMSTAIKSAMEAAGHVIRTDNPFDSPAPMLSGRIKITSPHVARIHGLWNIMRGDVIKAFAAIPTREISPDDYLAEVDARYIADAYNSLSIEGYRVTPELIERVRKREWDPKTSEADNQQRDALAARGYYLAFQAVKKSIGRILGGEAAAETIEQDFQRWYREMFAPSVVAGILEPGQLAGYRNNPVYLRGSRYVPPGHDAVIDCMDAFLELLHAETEPVVRAVLGHFLFVYIHPYSDGNGRIGRFLMNAGFASGRYPWTVIRTDRRDDYLAALEEASVRHDIRPFAAFVAEEMLVA